FMLCGMAHAMPEHQSSRLAASRLSPFASCLLPLASCLDHHPADDTDIIAIPQRAVPYRQPVRHGICIAQLNLLHNRSALDVVLEEGGQVRIAVPQVPPVEGQAMRAIARCAED